MWKQEDAIEVSCKLEGSILKTESMN